MIGDSDRDVQAGENAGCKVSVKIGTNEPNALLNMVKKIL
jgi:D-glycero-D-manno-heptose 1,7-bisphosphate phosphatase